MKTKMMLKIENKRLKKRNIELETRIEKINKMYNDNLKSLHDELAVLLEVLNNDKTKRIVADYPLSHLNRDNVQ